MASLKFRHYATESDLKGTGTIQAALNAFDVGTIVFIDSTQKQYIITSKTNNVVTYKIYYGEPAVVSVSGSGAALTLTWSDSSEETVTINDVAHATSADVSDTTKSVAWANVTGKPNIVTTDTEQTISGSKIFNNNTTFHNETDMESLTTDSLLVTGSARFTNTINGNLKGDVEGNLTGIADTAKTAAICTGNSATATALTTNAGSSNTPVYFTGGKPSPILIQAGSADVERPFVVITDNNELYKTSGITANYSKKSITATTFKGNLEGNASTATTASSCSGNSATATNADKLGNLSADNYFKQRDAAFNSEWTGKYLWTLWDNHLYAATKRFDVTLTGTTSTNFDALFDGSFESSVLITETQAVLHIKHTTAGNVWTSGLPYGSFYVVFYNSDAENVTGRVYCNYDEQGIGWHDLTVTHVRPHVWKLNNDYYQLSDLEITITKPASSASIQLCQVLHEVTRSAGPYHAAVMSKYCNQKTNYNIEAAKFIGPLQGNADTATTAITASSCAGNSATSTKLETARTLWGQSFDGSGNISGNISNTGNIIPSVTKTSDLGSNALSYRYVYTTWVGAPGNTKLTLGASNATHLTIDTNGNVGIGTTSPTSKLHVAGTGYFTGDASSAANIIAGGYIKGETVKISSGCTLEYDSTQKCVKFVFN